MDGNLVRAFVGCGDNGIVDYAILRCRLNSKEKQVLNLLCDECLTQEEAAERMCYSTRRVQEIWYSACRKLLSVEWVKVYAMSLV